MIDRRIINYTQFNSRTPGISQHKTNNHRSIRHIHWQPSLVFGPLYVHPERQFFRCYSSVVINQRLYCLIEGNQHSPICLHLLPLLYDLKHRSDSFNNQSTMVLSLFHVTATSKSHRADLLPLPIQFGLLVGLFETSCLSALGHLDAVLEGSPVGTSVIRIPSRTLWGGSHPWVHRFITWPLTQWDWKDQRG